MASTNAPNHPPQVDAALWNIRIDAATGQVIAALARGSVRGIVLKGPALNAWYPADQPRTYVDGDIWVAPDELQTAEATLTQLGFTPKLDERGLPDWWLEHASSWHRESDRGAIDLHRKLQGVGVEPGIAWELLWPESVPLLVGGQEGRRLSDPALAMYVALHAAHHGSAHGGAVLHLEAALTSVDDATWRRAARTAQQLEATDGFATGLRLVPAGAELAARLALPPTRSVRAMLQSVTPPPVALGFEQLASASGVRRLEILIRKLFPPRGFVRHWWPPAAQSPWMLCVGYLYRPVWLLGRAPAGWRAWRTARRAVGGRG